MKRSSKRTPRHYDGTGLTSRQLSDLLPAVLKKVRGAYGTRADQIIAAWPEVIGDRLSNMTRAESFYEGVLKVRVKNSTLHSLLEQHEKPRLLSQLRKLFPSIEIRTIIFKIG